MVSSLDMIFLLKHWAHIDVREMQENLRMADQSCSMPSSRG
jgi:hypothetical protein